MELSLQTKNVLVIGPESRLAKQFIATLQAASTFQVTTAGKYDSADFYLDLAQVTEDFSVQIEGEYEFAVVFGGMTKIAHCQEDPDLAMQVNCDAVLRLLDKLKVSHWLLFSTNLVFEGLQPQTYKVAPYSAINAYGRSKSAMEKEALARDKSIAVLRLTKVVQPYMELFDHFLSQLHQGKTIEVFKDMSLAPISAVDLMNFLKNLLADFHPGVYQLSGSEDVSYLDVVRYCADKLGFPEKLIHAVPKNIEYPKYTSLKVDNIEYDYQFVARSFREVFDEYLELSDWYTRIQPVSTD